MKKIGVIGVGRLGLCLALNIAKSGVKVIGHDINYDYITSLNNGSFNTIEPDVINLLNTTKNNIIFTSNLEKLVNECDVIFITVRTESNSDGSFDTSNVNDVLNELKKFKDNNSEKTIIINCNVSPGFTDRVSKEMINYNYKINYNPEWVAQGTIVHDQLNPEIVVIGEYDKKEGDKIESLYSKFVLTKPVIKRMSPLSAEITKVSLNCYLTTKIAFANMIGDLAIKLNQDPNIILSAIGVDSRIGSKYFGYGFGFGGPCFPRDNQALINTAIKNGIQPLVPIATIESNKEHLENQIEHFKEENLDKDKEIKMDSITYKKGVDIILESQQLEFAVRLAKAGYKIRINENAYVKNLVQNKYGDLFKYE